MPTRLSRHVREQAHANNWLAVFIDLAIVVLGVFLGIQAANWNETRKERAEERRYYSQLIEDLRNDQETLSFARQRTTTFDEAAEAVLQAFQTGVPAGVEPGSVVAQIHYAGFLYLPIPARRTYDELISVGNLRLLRNQAAKQAIANYYAMFEQLRQWDDLMRQQQGQYWGLMAGVLPRPVLQAVIRGRKVDISASEADRILADARSRDGARNLLIVMAAHQERVRRDSEVQSDLGRQLIRTLEPLARPE